MTMRTHKGKPTLEQFNAYQNAVEVVGMTGSVNCP
jgi:hypothetical protein